MESKKAKITWEDIHRPKPEYACELCGRWTSGQMGDGEWIHSSRDHTLVWWCARCHKCPHFGCVRMRCKKKRGGYYSHCGNTCRHGRCSDECRNG